MFFRALTRACPTLRSPLLQTAVRTYATQEKKLASSPAALQEGEAAQASSQKSEGKVIYESPEGGQARIVVNAKGKKKLRFTYPEGTQYRKSKPVKNESLYLANKYIPTLNSPVTLVFQDSNCTFPEMEATRLALRKERFNIVSVKNSVYRHLLKDTRYAELAPLLHGRISVAYYKLNLKVPPGATDEERALKLAKRRAAAPPEATLISKIIEITSKNRRLTLLGGRMTTQLLTADDIIRITKLPPKETLQAEALGIMEAPARNVLGLLSRPAQSLAQALDTHQENLQGPQTDKTEEQS